MTNGNKLTKGKKEIIVIKSGILIPNLVTSLQRTSVLVSPEALAHSLPQIVCVARK